MCNPTMIGVAMSVGGKVMQDKAVRKSKNARNTAINNNSKRQRELEAEARNPINKSTDMFNQDSFDDGNQISQNKFAALYNDTINTPNYSMPNIGSAPAIVEETLSNEMMKAAAFNKQQGDAKAKLASLGDYLATSVNPQLARSAEKGQMIGNFMQGEGNLLDAELQAANDLAYSPTAQILSGGGQAMTGYGLKK